MRAGRTSLSAILAVLVTRASTRESDASAQRRALATAKHSRAVQGTDTEARLLPTPALPTPLLSRTRETLIDSASTPLALPTSEL